MTVQKSVEIIDELSSGSMASSAPVEFACGWGARNQRSSELACAASDARVGSPVDTGSGLAAAGCVAAGTIVAAGEAVGWAMDIGRGAGVGAAVEATGAAFGAMGAAVGAMGAAVDSVGVEAGVNWGRTSTPGMVSGTRTFAGAGTYGRDSYAT